MTTSKEITKEQEELFKKTWPIGYTRWRLHNGYKFIAGEWQKMSDEEYKTLLKTKQNNKS